jgi:DNA repair photolyase
MNDTLAIRGRGASWNPANRFPGGTSYERDDLVEADPCAEEEAPRRPETVYLEDASKSVLSRNDSPDVGFNYSINPYRGCEHGCIYCYARPTHEYFGYSAGLDFETKIFVKKHAPRLLREEMMKPRWAPQMVAMSGNTDCYQPVERELKLTRQCLEVFRDFRNPVGIITKNKLVTRDIDVLGELAEYRCAAVNISVTTLDLGLNRILEPRSSAPLQRLEAIRRLSQAGIPVGVMVAPVIPGLTDHEMPKILEACADAGAKSANYVVLRLPHAVAPLFEAWLEQHFPERKEKVLNRLRAMRDGQLYKSDWGERQRGRGEFAAQVKQLFEVSTRRFGFNQMPKTTTAAFFRRPGAEQLELF